MAESYLLSTLPLSIGLGLLTGSRYYAEMWGPCEGAAYAGATGVMLLTVGLVWVGAVWVSGRAQPRRG